MSTPKCYYSHSPHKPLIYQDNIYLLVSITSPIGQLFRYVNSSYSMSHKYSNSPAYINTHKFLNYRPKVCTIPSYNHNYTQNIPNNSIPLCWSNIKEICI